MDINIIIDLKHSGLKGCDYVGLMYCSHCPYKKDKTCPTELEINNIIAERINNGRESTHLQTLREIPRQDVSG